MISRSSRFIGFPATKFTLECDINGVIWPLGSILDTLNPPLEAIDLEQKIEGAGAELLIILLNGGSLCHFIHLPEYCMFSWYGFISSSEPDGKSHTGGSAEHVMVHVTKGRTLAVHLQLLTEACTQTAHQIPVYVLNYFGYGDRIPALIYKFSQDSLLTMQDMLIQVPTWSKYSQNIK